MRQDTHETTGKSLPTFHTEPAGHVDGHAEKHIHEGHGAGHGPETVTHKEDAHSHPSSQEHKHGVGEKHLFHSEHEHNHEASRHETGQHVHDGSHGHNTHVDRPQD